jgi:hypothetical protein
MDRPLLSFDKQSITLDAERAAREARTVHGFQHYSCLDAGGRPWEHGKLWDEHAYLFTRWYPDMGINDNQVPALAIAA